MKKLPEQHIETMDDGTGTGSAGPMATPAPSGSAPLPGLDALGQP
jgi:hypothetical protein